MPLFWGVVDPREFLYHYTDRESALDRILPNKQFRFGPFSGTNDPRETRWVLGLKDDAGIPSSDPADFEVTQAAVAAAHAIFKVLCFTRDDPWRAVLDEAAPYGRGFAHSRMWAQYARMHREQRGPGHTGVCLIVDRAALMKSVDTVVGTAEYWAKDVTYADEARDEPRAYMLLTSAIRDLGLEGAVSGHVRTHLDTLFFRKHLDWSAEWEHRVVLRSERPSEDEFVSIADALRGVVIGEDFPSDDRERLDETLASFPNEIPTARCAFLNGQLNIIPLGGPPGAIYARGKFPLRDETGPRQPHELWLNDAREAARVLELVTGLAAAHSNDTVAYANEVAAVAVELSDPVYDPRVAWLAFVAGSLARAGGEEAQQAAFDSVEAFFDAAYPLPGPS